MRRQEETRSTSIVVVSGPALSGKTTYVQEHARAGDLIVDVDWIMAALSGLPLHAELKPIVPFAAAARDAIYERLERNSNVDRAWIITASEQHAQYIVQRFGARHVALQVGTEIQHQRRLQREQSEVWRGFLQG